MKKIILSIFLSMFGFVSAVQANTPKLLGEFNDWSAYFYEDGKNVVCYMASTPVKDEGKYTQRGNIYVVITHRPAEKSFDVVNFVAGYTYKKDAMVTVKIGKDVINRMFADKDKAWAINEDIDKELIASMKKGERMIVDGVSNKGTATKDTYSLSGFTAAYRAISSKCPRK